MLQVNLRLHLVVIDIGSKYGVEDIRTYSGGTKGEGEERGLNKED